MRLTKNTLPPTPVDAALVARFMEDLRTQYAAAARVAAQYKEAYRVISQMTDQVRAAKHVADEASKAIAWVNNLAPAASMGVAAIKWAAESQEQVAKILKNLGIFPGLEPIRKKIARSKGGLEDTPIADDILFIPDAVLFYGFGHLPSNEDPEGRQVEALPRRPYGQWQMTGKYLWFPPESAARSLPDDERDGLLKEALQAYESSGRNGLDPRRVIEILGPAPIPMTLFVKVDTDGDIDAQITQFKRWLPRARAAIRTTAVDAKRKRTEAARDTLIFTLRYTAGLQTRAIAKRLFGQQLSGPDPASPDARVRTALTRIRRALQAAAVELPPEPKVNVTRGKRKKSRD